MPWLWGSVRQYIANDGQDFVYCLVEKKGTGESGKIEQDRSGVFKYAEVEGHANCIKGARILEKRFFTELSKGERCEFEGKGLAVTILTRDGVQGEKLCDCYPIPDGESIIVYADRWETATESEVESMKWEKPKAKRQTGEEKEDKTRTGKT